jgi:hypothetical protein
MAIQISGTNVIDNSRNLVNTVNITASGTINGGIVATQAQAQAGTDNTKLMTPLRVAEAIAALGGDVINRIQRGTTAVNSPSPPSGGPTAQGTVNVPLTSVNTAKSLVSATAAGHFLFTGPGLNWTGSGSATLTSSTNLNALSGKGWTVVGPFGGLNHYTNSTTIQWEVIEFK